MPDIRIHRQHQLGLTKARKIARDWATHVEQEFGMKCSVLQERGADTVEFTRSGVKGRLVVAADHFDLEARLGLLLGAFARTIENEILKNLDERLVAQASPTRKVARKKD